MSRYSWSQYLYELTPKIDTDIPPSLQADLCAIDPRLAKTLLVSGRWLSPLRDPTNQRASEARAPQEFIAEACTGLAL